MTRRRFLSSVAVGAGALAAGCRHAGFGGGAAGRRPNVVIVMVDDMGYGDMSCHGNPSFKTPHLDRLHGQSVRFTQFHVAPMCTPTRGQLLTGVDCLRNGARWVGTENTHLRTDLPTLAEIFRDNGYRTGHFGKWHIGDNYPMRPQDRGFDESLWFPQQEVGTVNDYWGNDYFDDTYRRGDRLEPHQGYCTDVWFDQALAWMGDRAAEEEPFLCYIPTNVVHGPYYVDQSYRDRVGIEGLHPSIETFFGMLVNLDDNMGRLDRFLEEKGLADNTIVIFMTDNGATGGYNTYNAGMRGFKTHLWEGGHRVPCFVRWPAGGLRAPGDIAELAQVQDILPTLVDLCGIKPPAHARFDGTSLAPPLRGEAEMPDRTLVVQFQRRLEIKKWDACILWGPWRLLNAFDIDPKETPERRQEIEERRRRYEVKLELYNVAEDPHQDRDLYDRHPDVVERMKAYYEQWWAETEPELDIARPIVIGNDAENPALLSAPSWAETYFTQRSDVLEGRKANGYWNVVVDRAGEYEFELRRWPEEADTPIAGATNIRLHDGYVYGTELEGTALDITEARLGLADIDRRTAVNPEDKAAVFRVSLRPGPARLQTWFYDGNGEELCGAYYVTVRRLSAGGGA